jgi:hypothetical protein
LPVRSCIGEGVDVSNEVVCFRLRTRWLSLLAGPAVMAVWIAAVHSDPHFSGGAPSIALLAAVVSATTAFPAFRRAVAVSDDALVVRSTFTQRTLRWSDIGAVTQQASQVWVMTADGQFVLPLHRYTTQPEGGPNLADAVWVRWHERRGGDWQPILLSPWRPTMDVRGRTVLRPHQPSSIGWNVLVCWVVAFWMNPQVDTTTALVTTVAVIACCATASAAVSAWTAVIVDADGIVVRSASRWGHRYRFDEIVDIREVTQRTRLGSSSTRVALITVRETVVLPTPRGGRTWRDVDPAYHRKWAWLLDELHAHRTAGTAGPWGSPQS